MSVLKPQNSYGDWPGILGLSGTEGFEGIDSLIIAVQELSRGLLNKRVKRTLFTFEQASIVGVSATTLQWNDLSDWDEVTVNGTIAPDDAFLPQPTDERILMSCGLGIGGTTSDFTDAIANRILPDVGATPTPIASFGTFIVGHLAAPMVAPILLPMTLVLGETDVAVRNTGVGVLGVYTWSFFMLSAERGVMNLAPGI